MAARVYSNLGGRGKVVESGQLHSANAERMNLVQALAHRSVTLGSTVEDIITISSMWQLVDADDAVTRGDIIYAGSITPEVPWRRLAIGASGDVLYCDGLTPCWAPASMLGAFLPSPCGRGYILRSTSVPDWEQHYAACDGAAIYGDGLDVISSMTPTFKGTHTHTACIVMNTGIAGCSPVLAFIAGSNNDTAMIYLDDDPGGAGNSDIKIVMAGASGGDARVVFEQVDGTNVAGFHAAGQLSLEMDDFEIGRGEHETGVNDVKLVFDTTPTPSQIKIEDGDFNINTASRGIVHIDGVTSGLILAADGTRYIPTDPDTLGGFMPTPSGRGYILRSNATPAWEEHLANTDGAAIYGDGTDVLSSLTPTFKGVHTHTANVVLDDGSGDSPSLNFIGGTNNDTASIYLDDDAGAGQSDFRIKLPGNDANCQLEIHDSGDVAVLQINADGSIYMSDDQFIGINGGGRLVFDATPTPDQIELTDGDLALFSGADVIGYSDAGSTETLRLDSSAGYIGVADRVYHIGDLDNYVGFSTDQMTLHVGGVDMLDLVEAATDEATFKCNVTLNTGAADALWLRCSGDVANTEADIRAQNQLGLAADQDVHIFIDASNISSSRYFSVRKNAENVSGSTEVLRVVESGILFIGDTANGDMTVGITINQGANDDEIFALKSSDVGHGFTSLAETDTFFHIQKRDAAGGGALLRGIRDSGGAGYRALSLEGVLAENVDTTKTTAGHGIIELLGAQSSGDAWDNTVADGNLVSVRTLRGGSWDTVVIIDEDGDIYYDGGLNNYDDEDDALAVRDLAQGLAGMWNRVIEYNQEKLQSLGIVGPPDEKGNVMVSHKRLQALMMGAIGQLYRRIQELEAGHGI